MTELMIGAAAPDFELEGEGGKTLRLSSFAGLNLVLYFYPKDDTPGCTREAMDFSAALAAFAMAGAEVIGVSKDSPARHAKFREKYTLGIELGSDPGGKAVEAYGAWVEKSLYGRKYMGIDRSTFLIGRDGRIAGVWRKVKVPGHADAVLKAAQALD